MGEQKAIPVTRFIGRLDAAFKDGNYAYILRKCAPSLDYFKRPEEAQACRNVAKEIYYDRRE
jgi:hypothetical protein